MAQSVHSQRVVTRRFQIIRTIYMQVQFLLIDYLLLSEHLQFLHQTGTILLQIMLVFDQINVEALRQLLFKLLSKSEFELQVLDFSFWDLAEQVDQVEHARVPARLLAFLQRLLEVESVDHRRPLMEGLNLGPCVSNYS